MITRVLWQNAELESTALIIVLYLIMRFSRGFLQ
jgi:hypothetical protein